MTSKLRRMRPYHPRKRRTKVEMNRQYLHDVTHKMNANVGMFLVLLREGKKDSLLDLQDRVKTDFLKMAPEVRTAAHRLGEKVAEVVEQYLDSIDRIVHSNPICIDPASIQDCYKATERLNMQLKQVA